jgi:hypothetical protein
VTVGFRKTRWEMLRALVVLARGKGPCDNAHL